MKLQLIIDERERKVIPLIQAMIKDYSMEIDVVVDTIPLGDFIIKCDDKEVLIIERKCLSDLASSIKDGRYAEQSFRLNNYPIHNHNIIYLVEGNIKYYNPKYTRVSSKTLYSTMTSLLLYKGFSVVRTIDMSETCEYIIYMIDKLKKNENRTFYFKNEPGAKESTALGAKSPKSYTHVIKKTKKSNVTPDNIAEIILTQIPGVSSTTAIEIMRNFKSLHHLLVSLSADNKCLNNITYKTKSGQDRRISKKSQDNIIQYLLFQESNIIKIDI
tara:strand:- start:2704 stop:3519 length:816 start_codon:yes stop_codon:yes gene_type:complete